MYVSYSSCIRPAQKVLDKEVLADGQVNYKVHWYGYGDSDDSWESPKKTLWPVKQEDASPKRVAQQTIGQCCSERS